MKNISKADNNMMYDLTAYVEVFFIWQAPKKEFSFSVFK